MSPVLRLRGAARAGARARPRGAGRRARILAGAGALSLAACAVPATPTRAARELPPESLALLEVDPDALGPAELARRAARIDAHYWRRAQVLGMPFPPLRSRSELPDPDGFAAGGDAALYCGQALAAFSFALGATGSEAAFARVLSTLRGVYLLTHASGTPGVLARCAFPAAEARRWGYPERWQHRIEAGFVHRRTRPLRDPFGGGTFAPLVYYTRASRDQLTGLVFGLAVAWRQLAPEALPRSLRSRGRRARELVADIARAVYEHLRRHEWRIRDEAGRNRTDADRVDGLLRTQVLVLARRTSVLWPAQAAARARREARAHFVVHQAGDCFAWTNNLHEYFAWSLRALRALTVWLLAEDPARRQEAADVVAWPIWANTRGHQNALLAAARALTAPRDEAARREWLDALRSLALRPLRGWPSPRAGAHAAPGVWDALCGRTARFALPPHLRKPTGYSVWSKEPWDAGGGVADGRGEATGIDFLLPYWLGRWAGWIDAGSAGPPR